MAERQPTTGTRALRERSSSKYDYVKVIVHIDEGHYYVLSRFLISRALTAAKVDYKDAVRIALDLKKRLVDQGCLDVSQDELEKQLFFIMAKRGYSDDIIARYHLLSRFHLLRVPFIVTLSGRRGAGKSQLATLLAERLNMPSVVQTKLVKELLQTMTNTPKRYTGEEQHENESFVDLEAFQIECEFVLSGLKHDIQKCFKEGKSMIIEGDSINPSLFQSVIHSFRQESSQSSTMRKSRDSLPDEQIPVPRSPRSRTRNRPSQPESMSADDEDGGEADAEEAEQHVLPLRPEEKRGLPGKGIVIHFVLSPPHSSEMSSAKDEQIQEFLRAQVNGRDIIDVEVSADDIEGVLGRIHEYVLDRIQDYMRMNVLE